MLVHSLLPLNFLCTSMMLSGRSLYEKRDRPHVLVHEISVVGQLPRNYPVVRRTVLQMAYTGQTMVEAMTGPVQHH